MDLGGGGNGGIGGGGMMTADERKGGGNRLDFTSNGQTGGFHNSTHADGESLPGAKSGHTLALMPQIFDTLYGVLHSSITIYETLFCQYR